MDLRVRHPPRTLEVEGKKIPVTKLSCCSNMMEIQMENRVKQLSGPSWSVSYRLFQSFQKKKEKFLREALKSKDDLKFMED